MRTADLGSISSATLRTVDLLPVFVSQLSALTEAVEYAGLIADALAWSRIADALGDPESGEFDELGANIVAELADALQEAAPPYAYFGSHPGDGADFGFWLSESFESDFDGLNKDSHSCH